MFSIRPSFCVPLVQILGPKRTTLNLRNQMKLHLPNCFNWHLFAIYACESLISIWIWKLNVSGCCSLSASLVDDVATLYFILLGLLLLLLLSEFTVYFTVRCSLRLITIVSQLAHYYFLLCVTVVAVCETACLCRAAILVVCFCNRHHLSGA